MKQEILKHVNEFYLKVEGKKFKLSKVLKVEGFCKMSSNISVRTYVCKVYMHGYMYVRIYVCVCIYHLCELTYCYLHIPYK